MTVTASDLDAAISCVMSGLLPVTDRDWSVRAGTLEWDCWHTAEHIGDCLLSYAWQLAVQPTTRYVRAVTTAEKDASPAEVLEFAVTGGRVLAAMVRAAPAHVRAFHPAGTADPEGFAALGCNEALLHGNDIARGFGLGLDPPRDVCRRVLSRLYPHSPAETADADPWMSLLWTAGRAELPGRPESRWRPHPAPLTSWPCAPWMLSRGPPLDLRPRSGDLRPLGGHHRCRLTGAVFVGAETVVAVAYEVVCIRLENLAGGGWLTGASGDAYREWGRDLARIGPLGSATGLSRLVDVRFRPMVMHEGSAVLAIRWEAVGPGGGLFPVLDADITLAPYRESATLLSLAGAYRPPLGVIGALLDRVVLHRAATATVQEFVDRMGNAVDDPAAAGVPEAAGLKPGRTREPRPGC